MPKLAVAIVVSILCSISVVAQNIRSAVSLTGTDAATCTVPDPCRTFDVAISRTNAGGEVIVLSSAGYGPFTVDKSVSIISPLAYHAAIAPTSGDAITVNVDNAVVVLRGLALNGSLGAANGITFTGQTASASNTRLHVENCVISGFSGNGVNFTRNGKLFVNDTIVRRSGNIGIVIDGSPGLPSQGNINHALVDANTDGLHVNNASVAVRDSLASGNQGVGFWAGGMAGKTADLSADNCQATHNYRGFVSGFAAGTSRLMVSNSVASANTEGISGNNGTVRASNNTVTRNTFGFVQAGGTFESRGNNTVRGNTTETFGTITPFGAI